ncbi:MAG: transketolase [Chloroflexi bacterium]|nr:transketolase [Chloroflexota bacterium]
MHALRETKTRDQQCKTILELQQKARLIRRTALQMIGAASSGHPGGSLSCADILASLYFCLLNVRPSEPKWPDRDRFILSKGHAAPALYATLAEAGFFPKEKLSTFRQVDGMLQGHPDMKKTPGLDMTTGSLGHGLSAGVGMALAGKILRRRYHVFVLLGDGEVQEGQVWEAAMAASHHKLNNLIAILDRNKLQLDGATERIIALEPLPPKWRAFGWRVREIDGHDITQIITAIKGAKRAKDRPTIIIAHTVKGKGVSYMENRYEWHGKAPGAELLAQALKELEENA